MKVYQITPDMDKDVVIKVLDPSLDFKYLPCSTEDEIITNCSDADIIISIYEPMTQRVIDSLDNLKYIAAGSIGYDNIDVEYAKSKGIEVSNNPSYCIEEVADHAMGLILNSIRKICEFNESIKSDKEWDYNKYGNTLRRMSSLTVGLVGFGKISRQLNDRLQAFGCKILAYDPFLSDKAFDENNVTKATLEDIQEQADIISLHLPSNESTRGIIDGDFLKKCKKSPLVINCSRGDLIDEKDLVEALDEKWISGLGLDVLSSETPDLKDYPFLDYPNVIITPHVAFYSQESILEADTTVAEYINNYIKNEKEGISWV